MAYNKQDHYYKKAKLEGYRARSAYKLQQIQKKFHIMSRNNIVIDLGAAPGSWTQIASKIVGKKGKVISVDINPIRPFTEKNIITIQYDMLSNSFLKYFKQYSTEPVNAVLSDLATSTSGNWHLDSERQIHLATLAYEIATSILIKNGNFISKVFRGPTINEFESIIKPSFRKIKHWRPPATRKKSAEEYIICKGFIVKSE